MLRVSLILAIVFGFVSGWSIGQLSEQGYLTQWRPLPPPPTEIVELPLTLHATVYAKTNQGTMYQCSDWNNQCWLPTTLPPQKPEPVSQSTKPCDTAQSAFSRLTNPPLSIRDCIQGTEMYADGSGRYIFILSDNNRIWMWSVVHSPYDPTTRLFPVLGIIFGIMLVLVIALGQRLWRWSRSLQTMR
jgi:hypothetical protein